MADRTSIEWTDATWNPVTGCTKVSTGCDHCYAETFAERWRGTPGHPFEHGFDLQLRPERLKQPLRWRTPRRIFVNSMSDLFHPDVPDEYIVRVFAVMAATPQHTYQILTKRHGRMRSFLRDECRCGSGHAAGVHLRSAMSWAVSTANPNRIDHPVLTETQVYHRAGWPLPNVWLGVSVEDQKHADLRIPALLDTPAAVRWLSCEPLLGPVDLGPWLLRPWCDDCLAADPDLPMCDSCYEDLEAKSFGERTVRWVVVGGESGPGARPMHPDWVRSLRDHCGQAGVPFLFKQWGAWAPAGRGIGIARHNLGREVLVGAVLDDMGQRQVMRRVGKHAAGRELDGRIWDEFPVMSSRVGGAG